MIFCSLLLRSSLLSALSRSRDKNAPYRANEVFEQMLGAGIRADPMAWTILITLWSKSSIPNKENKVQQIFKRCVQYTVQYTVQSAYVLALHWLEETSAILFISVPDALRSYCYNDISDLTSSPHNTPIHPVGWWQAESSRML